MTRQTQKNACCPPDRPHEPLPRDAAVQDQELARFARALGHPARVRILRHLAATRGCIAGDLVLELPLAASTVSEHLKILKTAGLVKGEVDGPRRSYCVDRTALGRLEALLDALREPVEPTQGILSELRSEQVG